MKKSTGSVDKEIGSRVRMRRMLIGMSQEKLGEMLNLVEDKSKVQAEIGK